MIQFQGTRAEAEAVIRDLPAALAGRVPDAYGLARSLQLRAGVALLSQVQQAFITKSRGGVGSDGISWPPLKPETIAARRTVKGERKALGITGEAPRPSLTPAQDEAWRKKYFTTLRWARVDMDEKEAKIYAGKVAWNYVKTQMGAKTVLEILGSRKVDILRDTGELLRSLNPGVADRPSGAPGQVFRAELGRVVVGTNKKTWHHKGVPGKLPKRLLWPEDDHIPEAWWVHINEAIQSGLMEALPTLLGRAPR